MLCDWLLGDCLLCDVDGVARGRVTADDALRTGAALALVAAAGALAAAVLWRLAGSSMQRDRWMRPNYRGERIVATSGLFVVAVGAAGAAAVTVLVSASCEGA